MAEFGGSFSPEPVRISDLPPNIEESFAWNFSEKLKFFLGEFTVLGTPHFGVWRYGERSCVEFIANGKIRSRPISAEFVSYRPRYVPRWKSTPISNAEMGNRFNFSAKRLHTQTFHGNIGALQNFRLSDLNASSQKKREGKERDDGVRRGVGIPRPAVDGRVIILSALAGLCFG